jgi:hypothetical protein
MKRIPLLVAILLAIPTWSGAQGSRKDDIALGQQGRPVAGATVTVCTAAATGTPCAPLATIYTDATLTVPVPNPFLSDGLGNYHFYAAPGRYTVQISGAGITTYTMNDVILPSDPSSSSSGNNISAFSLNLGEPGAESSARRRRPLRISCRQRHQHGTLVGGGEANRESSV